MATNYELRIYNSAGSQTARVGLGMPEDERGDYIGPLQYTKSVNNPGALVFQANGDHPIIDDLTNNAQVEVWRTVDDNDPYKDFEGIYLEDYDYRYVDDLQFTAYVPGKLALLTWGIVAWKAATADRSKFTSANAETIAKRLVEYNVTSSAGTGAGRELDWRGPFTVTLQANGSAGPSLNWNAAWDNVHESLIDLTAVGSGDVDLIRDSADTQSFEFRWYDGQRGRDLTSDVVLSVERGNMTNVVYQHRGSQAKTAAVTGGRGKEADRDIVVRLSSDDGTALHREAFVNATNYDKGDTAGLQAAGDVYLDENRDVEKFTFDVLQTQATRYGVDYGINAAGDRGIVGDLVTVVRPHDSQTQTHKITQVTVSVAADGDENISIETEQQ